MRDQKVVFARDPENERRLRFCFVSDEVGDIEIKLTFGPEQTEGIAGFKLTADETMGDFVDFINDRIVSIEVPGSESVPIDTDGDGIPDGSSGSNDILRAFNAGSIEKPGAPVYDHQEDDPKNLVIAINDDDDDNEGQGGDGSSITSTRPSPARITTSPPSYSSYRAERLGAVARLR